MKGLNNINWEMHSINELERLSPFWDSINAANSNLPVLDSLFLNVVSQESSSRDNIVAVCRDEDGPVAAAILTRVGPGVWQTLQPSQAPMGAWVQRPSMSVATLLGELVSILPGPSFMVGLTQLDPDLVARPTIDRKLQVLDYIDTARVIIEGSFEDYWVARGSNLRKNLKRQRNRLEREGVVTSLEWITTPQEAEEAVDEHGLLESRGWKASHGTAIHPDNAQGRMYRKLLFSYCARGEGAIVRYRYNGKLVASDLCVYRGRVLLVLKTTYDEAETTTSPSYLLREESLRRVFASGQFDRIEFYGRVMDWHLKWTTDVRRLYHVNYFRSPTLAKLLAMKRRFLQPPLSL